MDVDGNYQAKVMINGETKVVPIHKDSPVKPTSSAIADKYVTYEVKDGAYKFTEITSSDSGLDEYSAAQVNSYKDGRIYANASGSGDEYLIDDDAVVYVKYNADKYAILSGKDVAGWGDKVKDFNSNKSLVLYKTSDTMKKIAGAFIDLGDEKMPASTVSYGVIVSDVIRATDDKYEFTLWNGTDTNTAKNYNLTKDTQIIYVDTSADNVEDICVNGGSIENASPAPEGKYYRNASFVIDSGSDLALLIVITNTDGAYPGSIKK